MAIHPGDVLAGYRVSQLLGRGGMGEVWAAADQSSGREVAIKVLLPRAALKPDLVLRFEREARAVAAIESPYVCRLHAIERDENGAHLLVFEKLEGESLADRLRRELYLPFAEVGVILEDVWQALAAAHRAGVIHRDLKPGNIFLQWRNDPDRPERAKVLDFGISKLKKTEGEPSLTDFDATLGSFAYMAPEQVRGAARVDERADIYAAGAVAFRALAGRLPFDGSSAGMIMALKVDRPAPTLSELTGEQWPAGLERFLAQALDRDRDARFATAIEALEAWRAILPLPMPRRPPPAGLSRPFPREDDRTAVDGAPTVAEFTRDETWSDEAATRTDFEDGPDPTD
ncbi:MAG: serine/threonine protein kinase [Deltaproteobacteria bacterium]|nr:serine/threonine protein kinase [Deltaproteobacteria bacterium]MBW2534858.1 serine/threonine protein kinase [Deltaproteobacteria bacterium]